MLVGGRGADLLNGGADEDLLISGYTAYDDDFEAIDSVFTEWNAVQLLRARSHNIRGVGTASVPTATCSSRPRARTRRCSTTAKWTP